MTELTGEHQRLVRQLLDLHARIAEMAERMNDIKSRLRRELTVGSYTIDNKPAVSLTPNRRFDPARAEEVLPPELLDLCRVAKVDPTTAKKVLPPQVYAQCSTEIGEPVVRLS